MAAATYGFLSLRLRVCTWNVGNAPPHWDMSSWLGTDEGDYDIIAIGAQEANFKEKNAESHGLPMLDPEEMKNTRVEEPGDPSGEPAQSRRALRKIGQRLKGNMQKAATKRDSAKGDLGSVTNHGRRSSLGNIRKETSFWDAGARSSRASQKLDGAWNIPEKTQSSSSLAMTYRDRVDNTAEDMQEQGDSGSWRDTTTHSEPNSETQTPPETPKNNPPPTPIDTPCKRLSVSLAGRMKLLDSPSATKSGSIPIVDSSGIISDDEVASGSSGYSSQESDASGTCKPVRNPFSKRTLAFSHARSRVDTNKREKSQETPGDELVGSRENQQEENISRVIRVCSGELKHKLSRGLEKLNLPLSPLTTTKTEDNTFDAAPDVYSEDEYDVDGLRCIRPTYPNEDQPSSSPLARRGGTLRRDPGPRQTAKPTTPPTRRQDPIKTQTGPPKPPPSASSPGSWKFSKCVQNCIGDDYFLVGKHHLMEIKLMLFVHKRHRGRIGRTEASSEATGIGNVVGNKGAVAMRLEVEDTTFCFISSHLAAHEGAKFLQQRNADVNEILRHLDKQSGKSKASSPLPSTHRFCHIIWMGDLNYRLDLERELPRATMMSHEEKWKHVVDAIERRDLAELWRYDELRSEMERKRVFANFSEGPLDFLPTFKVVRGTTASEYQRARIPSYCDRILWHSLPRHRDMITLLRYDALEEYCTSDHKPVYAVFDVQVARRMRRFGKVVPSTAVKAVLDFHELRLSGLYEKRSPFGGAAGVVSASGAGTAGAAGLSPQDGGGIFGPEYEVLQDGALSLRPLDVMVLDSPGAGGGPASPFGALGATPRRGSNDDWEVPEVMSSTGAGAAAGAGAGGGASAGAGAVATPTHTRRGVRAEFHAPGVFLRDKVWATDVALKAGGVRGCGRDELPKIPLVPLAALADVRGKYVALVFSRWGSKVASTCLLPLADVVDSFRRHERLRMTLELTKYGEAIASVHVDVELCVSLEAWIDSRNSVVRRAR